MLTHILDAMVQAAGAGEAVIQAGAPRIASLHWKSKGPSDFLTEVDTSSEDAIRTQLTRLLADDIGDPIVFGEESWTGAAIPPQLCFVVDPLDGTTNFLHGVPVYAVSIAALWDGEPIIGVVRHAAREELYTAIRGAGARLNGERMSVSSITDPARALIATGFPFGAHAELERYARQFVPVARVTAGIRRAGAAALDLAHVAAGRYEAFWELDLAPWDIAAGLLLIEESGGVVTDLQGEPACIETSPLVAGSPRMHAWLLDTLIASDAGEHSA
jgi:myo-inositol-1(or 4)-monophosphatase